MGRPRYPVTMCLLLAGGPLVADPCPAGGADHAPMPTGYGDRQEYAYQLLSTGWTQHRCAACRLWAVWLPDQPQPQPPMLPNPDDEHGVWDIPDDADPCPECDDEELDDEDVELDDGDRITYRHTDTLQPLARYL